MQIHVHPYKVKLGQSEEEHLKWVEFITQVIRSNLFSTENIEKVEIYNLPAEYQSYNAGNEKRFVVFGNATQKSYEEQGSIVIPEAKPIFGVANDFQIFLPAEGLNAEVVFSENGYAVAEYIHAKNELNILFDLFGKFNATNKSIFTKLVDKMEQIFARKLLRYSWVHSDDKATLSTQIQERYKQSMGEEIDRAKRDITSIEQSIISYKNEIGNLVRRLDQRRNIVGAETNFVAQRVKKITDDLDIIAQLDKVHDVIVRNSKILIKTKPIYIYDEKGNRYYGGNYTIELVPEHSVVKFFGDNPRRSHWSQRDPHPHVNGQNGEPCLGNLAPTIAELSAQYELYALTICAIDFLESVNTADVAGRRVENWDKVDDNGNIISAGVSPVDVVEYEQEDDNDENEECHECDEMFHPENMNTAFDEDGENERRVCDGCLAVYYVYDNDADEWRRN
jgi:hypothetical protein